MHLLKCQNQKHVFKCVPVTCITIKYSDPCLVYIHEPECLHTNDCYLLFTLAQLFQFLVLAQDLVQLLLQLLPLLLHLHLLYLLT